MEYIVDVRLMVYTNQECFLLPFQCNLSDFMLAFGLWLTIILIFFLFLFQLVEYNNDGKQENLNYVWPWWFWQGMHIIAELAK